MSAPPHPANLTEFKGNSDMLTNIIKASGLVLVDFYAPWCPPCKRVGEELPTIAQDQPKVTFIKVNVEENEEISNQYDISSIPHIKFFRGVNQNGVPNEIDCTLGANLVEIREKVRRHSQ